ncbi:unnamed protein product (macronuclear) [Paramecium tetraurelia]|uniref:Uncharacterized protein n=1 Tax=Paramecium tetraurelia TaxID=5888 RepID=A0BR92_PARTE|nr:uncharacterized protein GSPATT00031290001 [Paramecium tetraurelia]CAK61059.1 unnamed protein product [Paramecium tetraurelia]|eukprot:XP_001428457.1 hypothetical protein (macronuclear) [Paramecium tetraurelia strain d4-2]
MGTCQVRTQNINKNIDDEDQIETNSQPNIQQLQLTPLVCNIVGDQDRMDDLFLDLERQPSLNPIQQTTNLQENFLLSSKGQITHDPQSQTLDHAQQTNKSPKKSKNLNAKFKEMIY